MSRGLGKVERQILAVLEADQGAHLCFSLESLVYTVLGYNPGLGEDYLRPQDRWCDCPKVWIPELRTRLVQHEPSCTWQPAPWPEQESSVRRAVRSLERKGVLKSTMEGRQRYFQGRTRYPARMKYLWRAETPMDQICAWARAQRGSHRRCRFIRLILDKCTPCGTRDT